MLRRESDSVIDDNVLIALTDHISMALEREQAGIICDNPLLFEIKRFYGREFELALKAREIIRGHLGIEISEAEVGFIALHIVNATMKQRADHLMLSIKMINGILNTVSETFGLTYDEGSVQYERFLRHLQFFSQRVLDKSIAQSEDTFLFHLGKDQYPDALECTERIRRAYRAGVWLRRERCREGISGVPHRESRTRPACGRVGGVVCRSGRPTERSVRQWQIS